MTSKFSGSRTARALICCLVAAAPLLTLGAPARAAVVADCSKGIRAETAPFQKSFNGIQAWVISRSTLFERGAYCQLGKTKLILQEDGNVGVYVNGKARWASGTAGRAEWMIFQSDGNLGIYGREGHPIWDGAHTPGALHLAVQSDGNVVIYDDVFRAKPKAMWASRTVG